MLYWIYVLVFISNVMVPILVHENYIPVFFAPQQITEIVCLFVINTIGFSIYLMKHYTHERFVRDCGIYRRDAVNTAKDLNFSYSYIGEINRKIDILKSLIVIPANLGSAYSRSKTEIYSSILKAIEGLAECRNFFLGLYDKNISKSIKTVQNGDAPPLNVDISSVFNTQKTNAFPFEDCYIVKTGYDQSGLCAFAVLKKSSLKNETIDLVKTVLQRMLFLYTYTSGKSQETDSEEKYFQNVG